MKFTDLLNRVCVAKQAPVEVKQQQQQAPGDGFVH